MIQYNIHIFKNVFIPLFPGLQKETITRLNASNERQDTVVILVVSKFLTFLNLSTHSYHDGIAQESRKNTNE